MPGVKIAIIGAGSVAWSAKIIRDLCVTPELYGSRIVLVDIDRERLDLAYGFATRYASEVKADLKIEKTMDRRKALVDADFVVNMAMAMGHGYYEKMRMISEKYGYYRGINSVEWNMVSDYHTVWGYYQFKLVMSIVRDIEEACPDAWLIELANPVFEITTLVGRESKVKVIGLCHGHLGCKDIARVLGLNFEEAEFEAIGFNHTIWLTKFRYKGEDAYPLLDEWIEKNAEDYWRHWRREQKDPFDVQMSPAAVDMYKVYGLFPVGDTVRNGTWKYHWNLETKKKWFGPLGGPDSEIGWTIYLKGHIREIEKIKDALKKSLPLTSLYPPERSDEEVVPVINSIANNEESIRQVNVPNRGAIAGIPNDVTVEIPARVEGGGVHRITGKRLPERIMKYVIYPRMMRMEWALEAFLEGGRDLLFEWLITDPRTKSPQHVDEVINALLSIPENREMARHFN